MYRLYRESGLQLRGRFGDEVERFLQVPLDRQQDLDEEDAFADVDEEDEEAEA